MNFLIKVTNSSYHIVTDQLIITGEFTSLVQIMVNLIINSIESYDQSTLGKIIITAGIKEYEEKNYIVISVQDFGCGINESVKNKLLNQIFTTKGHKGNGIGIYLSNLVLKDKFNGFLTLSQK